MAKPIPFKPITVDFKADLQRRLEKAPEEHAAAQATLMRPRPGATETVMPKSALRITLALTATSRR